MSEKMEAVDAAIDKPGLRDEYITSKLEPLDCGELRLLRQRFQRRLDEGAAFFGENLSQPEYGSRIANYNRLTRTVALTTMQFLSLLLEAEDYES